jgi:predicted phage terminase large subunit-like protein
MLIKFKIPEFNPHNAQLNILRNAKSRNVLRMGRRFGKTELMKEIILNRRGGALAGIDGTGKKGLPCAWYAPKDAYLTQIFQDIVLKYDKVIKKKPSAPRPMIEFINGGRIDFWTLKNPLDCGRGNSYSRIVIDEAAHAINLETAWEKSIEYTLLDFDGDAWFISTPNGMNYFYELDNKSKKNDNWISFHAPSSDNPYLPQAWLKEKEEEMLKGESSALIYSQEILAEYVTFGAGLIKPQYILTANTPKELPVVLGVDLAISTKENADWTAIVAMCKDEDGVFYIKEVIRFRSGFHDVVKQIKEASYRHNPRLILIENTQYQVAVVQELIKTTFLPVRGIRPDRDKISRFAPLVTRYEQFLVRHDVSGVPNWFKEEVLAFPEGKNDDGVDAASYAFYGLSLINSNYSATRQYHG